MTLARDRLWQIVLLLPQPPLTLLYLVLVRGERLRPSFVPVVVLTLLPLGSLLLAVPRRGAATATRTAAIAVVVLAVLELAWGAASAALVGFAIAARSG